MKTNFLDVSDSTLDSLRQDVHLDGLAQRNDGILLLLKKQSFIIFKF